ncbi:J domain-containing protein [Synechococcus sp. CS-1329]|uniref:J domain-containing protein n=1 Tax=Synechococcus sp. CS-1329 TaxID=2847975 RepID=UPI00223A7505|nr:J domain-containing protein [Synechococcus sp. CS-1329]MCT0219103.1 J domain-containing protein [Synechococcus sp. CS-1329]
MVTRAKKLTLPEVSERIQALLSQSALTEADLLAFARAVNGSDFKVPPPPKPKPVPRPKAPTLAEVKSAVLAHFDCKTAMQLKKNKNFQMSMTGDQIILKNKEDWLRLYRRFVGIPSHERGLEAGPTVINGIDVLKHFRPWVVFDLDPKTASADDVREAFRALIKVHHPDHNGDPRVAERLQKMKDSVLALM